MIKPRNVIKSVAREDLESENEDLKSKLDNIHEMAESRNYDYNDLLDDIEAESEY